MALRSNNKSILKVKMILKRSSGNTRVAGFREEAPES
jgi:hypothetical protein